MFNKAKKHSSNKFGAMFFIVDDCNIIYVDKTYNSYMTKDERR